MHKIMFIWNRRPEFLSRIDILDGISKMSTNVYYRFQMSTNLVDIYFRVLRLALVIQALEWSWKKMSTKYPNVHWTFGKLYFKLNWGGQFFERIFVYSLIIHERCELNDDHFSWSYLWTYFLIYIFHFFDDVVAEWFYSVPYNDQLVV